jgi:hypothetical protein
MRGMIKMMMTGRVSPIKIYPSPVIKRIDTDLSALFVSYISSVLENAPLRGNSEPGYELFDLYRDPA